MDARDWDERYAATRQWSETPNELVASRLADLAPGRALDLACGEGRNALWLASRGWSVTALDFSAAGIERGRQVADRSGLEVEWVVADALTHPLPEVDLVVVAYLQLPAGRRRTALRRAWASLAPGGTLLVVAHDSTNLDEGTGGPQDPAVLYTAGDVVADVAATPDDVVTAERVPRVVHREDEHGGAQQAVAWDALAHLVKPAATG